MSAGKDQTSPKDKKAGQAKVFVIHGLAVVMDGRCRRVDAARMFTGGDALQAASCRSEGNSRSTSRAQRLGMLDWRAVKLLVRQCDSHQ
jgi:hypothetical protein